MDKKMYGLLGLIVGLVVTGLLLFGNVPAEDAGGRLVEVVERGGDDGRDVSVYEVNDPRRNLEDVEVRHVNDRDDDDMQIAPENEMYTDCMENGYLNGDVYVTNPTEQECLEYSTTPSIEGSICSEGESRKVTTTSVNPETGEVSTEDWTCDCTGVNENGQGTFSCWSTVHN